jgi:hypothetical protein
MDLSSFRGDALRMPKARAMAEDGCSHARCAWARKYLIALVMKKQILAPKQLATLDYM